MPLKKAYRFFHKTLKRTCKGSTVVPSHQAQLTAICISDVSERKKANVLYIGIKKIKAQE